MNEWNLAKILIETFSQWVGTPSEELLEDGAIVEQILYEERMMNSETFDSISKETWENAWDIFDDVHPSRSL